MAGRSGQWTVLPPTRHATIDQATVPLTQHFWAQAEPLHDTGPEGLDQYVSLLSELQALFLARGPPQVWRAHRPDPIYHSFGPDRHSVRQGKKVYVSLYPVALS